MSALGILGLLFAGALGTTIAIFKKYYMGSTDNQPVIAQIKPTSSQKVEYSTPVETTPVAGKISHLALFCDAITAMEGANPANNNPGNCRCSPVGYLPMYGNVTCNPHNFAVFPTKALGRTYLENMVHFRALRHPDWTIYDFFANYAPSSDGNEPRHYAEFVANWCKVVPTTSLKALFA